jgi:hypothetical protein
MPPEVEIILIKNTRVAERLTLTLDHLAGLEPEIYGGSSCFLCPLRRTRRLAPPKLEQIIGYTVRRNIRLQGDLMLCLSTNNAIY